MKHRGKVAIVVVLTALACALEPALALAAVEPDLPVSCDSLQPYVCGEHCVGYVCGGSAPSTDLCKDHFAGAYSCVYWPGHRCRSGWSAIF